MHITSRYSRIFSRSFLLIYESVYNDIESSHMAVISDRNTCLSGDNDLPISFFFFFPTFPEYIRIFIQHNITYFSTMCTVEWDTER